MGRGKGRLSSHILISANISNRINRKRQANNRFTCKSSSRMLFLISAQGLNCKTMLTLPYHCAHAHGRTMHLYIEEVPMKNRIIEKKRSRIQDCLVQLYTICMLRYQDLLLESIICLGLNVQKYDHFFIRIQLVKNVNDLTGHPKFSSLEEQQRCKFGSVMPIFCI